MAQPLSIVKAALAGAAPVAALVEDRISPEPIKQGQSLPAIGLRRVSTQPNTHLRGDGHLDEVRVQVDYHADTATAALDLAAKGRAALEAAGVPIGDDFDDYDELTRSYVVTQDCLVFLDPTA